MGQERFARVTFRGPDGDSSSDGKALLETSELVFRGDFRLRIPFREIADLVAQDGALTVTWPAGHATFDLGVDAEKWSQKIRSPRGLLEKLGLKPAMRIAVLGVSDQAFLHHLREVASDIAFEPQEDADIVFFEADEVEDLARLAGLRASITDNGAIWVVSPKGKGAAVKDVDVMAAARAAGLVDTKVVSFSNTHTALKLVVPVASRGRH